MRQQHLTAKLRTLVSKRYLDFHISRQLRCRESVEIDLLDQPAALVPASFTNRIATEFMQ